MKGKLFLYALLFLGMLITGTARAQILNVANGTDLTIKAGTTFWADSLMLIPSADFVISNNTLSRSSTIIHSSYNNYISRVYQFTNNSNAYNGDIWIYYQDGAELNGIPENMLTLNMHNGTTVWTYAVATFRDGTNNYVRSDGVILGSISELTLAHLSAPLPLGWLSFTASKQYQTGLLKWTNVHEQNISNYEVQHSLNGSNWTLLGTQPAMGNNQYSFIHTTPATGVNYYRILQNDNNGRKSSSDIKTLLFSTRDEPFIITGNPVINNVLTIQVNTVTGLAFYTADGKLLWQEQANPGTKTVDVSRYAKGTYFLKANSTTKKVVIQ